MKKFYTNLKKLWVSPTLYTIRIWCLLTPLTGPVDFKDGLQWFSDQPILRRFRRSSKWPQLLG
jgi:hypothetical protein